MNNILVVSDIHSPFIKEGYLEHCIKIKKKYKCNQVIFIGDIIDNSYTSYHETDPDGYSAGDELGLAIKFVSPFYKAFPKADVCIGNHDRLIIRKAMTAGISNKWIKGFSEVLSTPNWNFNSHFIYDNVLYTHGEGGTNLQTTVLNKGINIVRGHYHTKFEIVYTASGTKSLWGMTVGCGIDIDSYAMEYAKFNLRNPIIGCGVVLENGRLPILEKMI